MGLSFKKNMFWCWEKCKKTECLIGFTVVDWKHIFVFRDRLAKNFSNKKDLVILKSEGQPTKADSVFRLVDKKDEKIVYSFLNRKVPCVFTNLFKTKKFKNWQREWNSITKLIRVETETSHDFHGLMINSTLLNTEELTTEIKNVSKELEVELCENKELDDINIFTNRTFK